LLADGARDFEHTERALASFAARALVAVDVYGYLDSDAGADALRRWLVGLAATARFDVFAVALRWVSGGPGAGHGAGDLGVMHDDSDATDDDARARSVSDKHQASFANEAAWRALGGAEGVAAAALEASRACPAGDDPEANAAALAAALDAMAPSAKATASWAHARNAAAAARVFAGRKVDVAVSEILRAAEQAMSSSSSSNETETETDGPETISKRPAIELLRRVAASAVRDASGPNGFPRGGPGAWSRRLWGDLSALQGGAFAETVSREDAAAEMLRAQLRCGNGAGSADFARRTLAELFDARASGSGQSGGAENSNAGVRSERTSGTSGVQGGVDPAGEDVTVGAAVRVVAGAAAGELVTAAGDRLRGAAGALGGMVRDARAGARAGGAFSGALGGALGGLVGGLGAGIAELHAGSRDSTIASKSGPNGDSNASASFSAPPPALPARRAASLVAETAAEFLFAAVSSSPEDENLRRAEEILACVPESTNALFDASRVVDETRPTRITYTRASSESLPALRLFAAATRRLASFGLDLPPVKLKKRGVCFVQTRKTP
jgi:hypothetical protein